MIENRAAYRSLCFSTPGLSEHISGVILHWETLFQDDAQGKAMVDIIRDNGMVPGIKVWVMPCHDCWEVEVKESPF